MDADPCESGAPNVPSPKFFEKGVPTYRVPILNYSLTFTKWCCTVVSMRVYIPKIDAQPVPLVVRKTRGVTTKVHYAFDQIPVGGSGTFDRAEQTIKNALVTLQRMPEFRAQDMRFRIRPVTKHLTRVWRIK